MINNFRIIPALLVIEEALYKTVKFKDPKYIGDPINAIRIFNEKEVDEIIVLDICVSKGRKEINFEFIEKMAGECFMPMTYGGGIKSLDDASRLFSLGIEKVSIQQSAISNPSLITSIANKYGNQGVVFSIDIKKDLFGRYKVYSYANKTFLKPDWRVFIDNAIAAGAGEIMITFIDQEGTRKGLNLELLKEIVSYSSVPVIGHGGIGTDKDIYQGYLTGSNSIAVGTHFVLNGPHKAVLISYITSDSLMKKFKHV